MKPHFLYLSYVLRHKWFVFLECRKLGVPLLNAILHDWDKFLPDEWFPYVNHFYGSGKRGRVASATGYIKADDVGDEPFDRAVALHCSRNKHHWEYWVKWFDWDEPGLVGAYVPLPMPDVDRREMLADWYGAGRAQGSTDNRAWYLKNRDRLNLHPETRTWIEQQLGVAIRTGRVVATVERADLVIADE